MLLFGNCVSPLFLLRDVASTMTSSWEGPRVGPIVGSGVGPRLGSGVGSGEGPSDGLEVGDRMEPNEEVDFCELVVLGASPLAAEVIGLLWPLLLFLLLLCRLSWYSLDAMLTFLVTASCKLVAVVFFLVRIFSMKDVAYTSSC